LQCTCRFEYHWRSQWHTNHCIGSVQSTSCNLLFSPWAISFRSFGAQAFLTALRVQVQSDSPPCYERSNSAPFELRPGRIGRAALWRDQAARDSSSATTQPKKRVIPILPRSESSFARRLANAFQVFLHQRPNRMSVSTLRRAVFGCFLENRQFCCFEKRGFRAGATGGLSASVFDLTAEKAHWRASRQWHPIPETKKSQPFRVPSAFWMRSNHGVDNRFRRTGHQHVF
jgi:hypothetical protein